MAFGGVTQIVTLPITPITFALVATSMLALTFYVGRWFGQKSIIDRIAAELENE